MIPYNTFGYHLIKYQYDILQNTVYRNGELFNTVQFGVYN